MRILHVIANLAPRYGGPPKACFEMARAVARRGHQVRILTTNQDGDGALDVPLQTPVMRDGVEITYYPVHWPRFWGTSIPLGLALPEAIRDADVVHIHSLYLFHDWVASYLCRRHRKPYLLRPHGTLDPYIYSRHRWRKRVMERIFQETAIRCATAIHFTSVEEQSLARPFVFETNGIVIPLGLDMQEYAALPPPGTFRARYPEVGAAKLILFLGRINFKKGMDILIKAFARVARQRQDVRLVVAGPDDGLEQSVRQWIQSEGVQGKVTFTGILDAAGKLAALQDASLFALPSYGENFGIAVIEAMACGKPVLISDRVALAEQIAERGAGTVLACDEVEFANAILETLSNPEAAARMGKSARDTVRELFQWDGIALQLETAYLSAIGQRRDPMESRG